MEVSRLRLGAGVGMYCRRAFSLGWLVKYGVIGRAGFDLARTRRVFACVAAEKARQWGVGSSVCKTCSVNRVTTGKQ